MARSRSSTPLLVFLAVLAAAAGVFFVLSGGDSRGIETRGVIPTPRVSERPAGTESTAVEVPEPVSVRLSEAELKATTVLWPLRVELDLIEAGYLPSEPGMAPIGSGATAILHGRVLGRGDAGARAKIRFVAGANEGRELYTDVEGDYGATDLYPGLSIVEVSGPGLLGSRRELRLRQGKETIENFTYAAPGAYTAVVKNAAGEPIEGASIRLDGLRASTDAEGVFYYQSVSPGRVLLEIEHPDYARYQENVFVTSSRMAPRNDLSYTLERPATMRIALSGDVGGPGPALVYLVPGQFSSSPVKESWRDSRYPYHHVNPIEVWPSAPTTVGGLRAEAVQVYAFRPGAEAKMRVANLQVEKPYDLRIELEPAKTITGYVRQNGSPVIGAEVTLVAPNQVRAMLSFLRQSGSFLETAVMPSFPPARQVVSTDKNGRFQLSAWESNIGTRFLEARDLDGVGWAGRLLHVGEYQVDLELGAPHSGDASLFIDLPGRFQGLPIELLVNGQPRDTFVLEPSDDLEVDDLFSGRWKVRLSWHSEEIAQEDVQVSGTTRRRYTLPPACIEGQDEETWTRAGREYPRP